MNKIGPANVSLLDLTCAGCRPSAQKGVASFDTQKIATGSDKKVSTEKEMEKAATDFEALLLHQMMESMWATVPQDGMLSGSKEEGMYRDMLNQEITKSIAEGRSIGVKEVILKDMKRLEGKTE